MRIAELAGYGVDARLRAAYADLDPHAPDDYRQLAVILAEIWSHRCPARVGLAGGQGAGKSTLGRLIEAACLALGLRACVLGLDDFYLTQAGRVVLARDVHPLLQTRGVPGTHDVKWCGEAIRALGKPGSVEVPLFDKGLDDRAGSRVVQGGVDLVILEGWCVGAQPVTPSDLENPINALESEQDVDGSYRRWVNQQLANEYAELWSMLDQMVYLRVPSMEAVSRWRLQQEAGLPVERRLGATEIGRFIQHYERITRSMWDDMPSRADVVVDLDEAHRVSGLRLGAC